MESDNKQPCQTALYEEEETLARLTKTANFQGASGINQQSLNFRKDQMCDSPAERILKQLHNKQLLIVNPKRRNGIILYKRYHAEFAGPGSAVGVSLDTDCQKILPVGNLDLISPESADDRQRAYLIRRQWVRLTLQITENPEPIGRAQKIIEQFEGFFDSATIAKLPDEAFSLLVGVLPHTVAKVRGKR
ncbi:hypothetical protein [Limnofasciculus baicalensis]|uniref:Uncharacterized protein n=1 Tax=Limnofasciculus baicalensis BBK-W-15 TaxID=2699891 RepID=A0AAE3GVK9_9CYAN|nr:hypothetical protein [Limnofasciculus baicalensis]MCP2730872.1 hypothetical protein [Limnofasciculus baicalensis BBK-W-15]